MTSIRFGRMTRSARGARALLVSGCILVVSVAGCAGTHPGATPTSEPPIGPITKVTTESEVVRPIDAYLPNLQEVGSLWRARYDAMNRCLSDHGSSATFVQPPNTSVFIANMIRSRTTISDAYGFFDVENAAKYGYHLPPAANAALVDPVPEGVSTGLAKTCRDAGTAAMAGVQSIVQLADSKILPDGGPPLAVSDSRFLAGVKAWSKCMATRGYPDADPVNFPMDARWRGPNDASGADIPAAMADIDCKVSTNLVGIYLAVQSADDRRYIDTHVTQLVAFRDKFESAIRGSGG